MCLYFIISVRTQNGHQFTSLLTYEKTWEKAHDQMVEMIMREWDSREGRNYKLSIGLYEGGIISTSNHDNVIFSIKPLFIDEIKEG